MNWFIIATLMGDSYRKSRSSSSSMNWLFLLVGVAVVLLAVGWYFWDQKQKKTKQVVKKKSISLFQELCNLHQLTSSEQTLLQQAVHGHSIKQGALAFLDPAILSHQAEQNQSESQQWIDLKTKLFGE